MTTSSAHMLMMDAGHHAFSCFSRLDCYENEYTTMMSMLLYIPDCSAM